MVMTDQDAVAVEQPAHSPVQRQNYGKRDKRVPTAAPPPPARKKEQQTWAAVPQSLLELVTHQLPPYAVLAAAYSQHCEFGAVQYESKGRHLVASMFAYGGLARMRPMYEGCAAFISVSELWRLTMWGGDAGLQVIAEPQTAKCGVLKSTVTNAPAKAVDLPPGTAVSAFNAYDDVGFYQCALILRQLWMDTYVKMSRSWHLADQVKQYIHSEDPAVYYGVVTAAQHTPESEAGQLLAACAADPESNNRPEPLELHGNTYVMALPEENFLKLPTYVFAGTDNMSRMRHPLSSDPAAGAEPDTQVPKLMWRAFVAP